MRKRISGCVAATVVTMMAALASPAMGAELLRVWVPNANLTLSSDNSLSTLGIPPGTVNSLCENGLPPVPQVWNPVIYVQYEVCAAGEPPWGS